MCLATGHHTRRCKCARVRSRLTADRRLGIPSRLCRLCRRRTRKRHLTSLATTIILVRTPATIHQPHARLLPRPGLILRKLLTLLRALCLSVEIGVTVMQCPLIRRLMGTTRRSLLGLIGPQPLRIQEKTQCRLIMDSIPPTRTSLTIPVMKSAIPKPICPTVDMVFTVDCKEQEEASDLPLRLRLFLQLVRLRTLLVEMGTDPWDTKVLISAVVSNSIHPRNLSL